jgi:hypothetical protein
VADQPSTPVVETRGSQQDPSPLVIQTLHREIAQLNALLESRIVGLRSEMVTKFEALDKALSKVEQYPTDLDRAIARTREYVDERFKSTELRFIERDARFAVRDEGNTALLNEQRESAAKAITKAEIAVSQQLSAHQMQITEVKERLDKTAGSTEGAIKLWGIIVAAIMVVGTLVGIFVAIIARM